MRSDLIWADGLEPRADQPPDEDARRKGRRHAHVRAELARQHLRAEADPQERPLLLQRHADEIGFGLDEIFRVVGAHRAAGFHGALSMWRRSLAIGGGLV